MLNTYNVASLFLDLDLDFGPDGLSLLLDDSLLFGYINPLFQFTVIAEFTLISTLCVDLLVLLLLSY